MVLYMYVPDSSMLDNDSQSTQDRQRLNGALRAFSGPENEPR